MNVKNKIGYAVRFIESEQTFTHLDILREYGKVLWGQWRKPGGKGKYSATTWQDINTNGAYFYEIGQTTVWRMHVERIMSKEEVIQEKLELLIPSYYSINTDCYCWYLVDDIEDYGSKDCLTSIYSLSGQMLARAHQIAGNAPWKVYSTGDDNGIVKYTPKQIARAYNPEREKMNDKLRYEIMKRDNFRCVLCGRNQREDGVKLHVDHFIPIAAGGKTEWDNLRTLCEDCNLGKSSSLPTWINGELIG